MSNYARSFILQYCSDENGNDKGTQYNTIGAAHWSGTYRTGTFNACCTSGIVLMYEDALGINITAYSFDYSCNTVINKCVEGSYKNNWEIITSKNDLQPGDILINRNPRSY